MSLIPPVTIKNLKIQGVMVKFPVSPYRSQLDYMNSLLKCLNKGTSGLLESPTGSGKSLALLGASLAYWKQSEVSPRTRIYVATRTHSQIKQMISELKRFEKIYTFKMTPLGSRKHSVICPKVSKKVISDEECRKHVKNDNCDYKNRAPILATSDKLDQVFDIDDLIRVGRQIKASPFYAMKIRSEDADVIVAPYQYLLNPRFRKALNLRLKNSIVIFDEAHNIENVCRDSVTNSFHIYEFKALKAELESLADDDFQPSACAYLSNILKTLIAWVSNEYDVIKSSTNKKFEKDSRVYTSTELEKVLIYLGIDNTNYKEFATAVKALTKSEDEFSGKELSQLNSLSQSKNQKDDDKQVLTTLSLNTLENLNDAIHYLFYNYNSFRNNSKTSLKSGFNNFVLSIVPPSYEILKLAVNKKKPEIDLATLNFWCMNPEVAFGKLHKKCHSVLLTSGTLSPMGTFSSELGINFDQQLSTDHVITKGQYFVSSIGTGLKGELFLGTYKNVDKHSYQDQIGGCILESVLRIQKSLKNGGTLIFLPSYSLLRKFKNRWENTGLLDKLGNKRVVLFEPQSNAQEFPKVIKKYTNACNNGYAVLFAVCRGKASEGIDFSDNLSRVVIVIGIPYAHFGDMLVRQKIEWNDKCHEISKGKIKEKGDENIEIIKGRTWYELQAFRAVNQAAGRCIRHRLDFGAILFLDTRFEGANVRKQISKWINSNFTDSKDTKGIFDKIEEFLKGAKEFTEKRRLEFERRASLIKKVKKVEENGDSKNN